MEGVADSAPREHIEASVLAQNHSQNCPHPEEARRAGHQEPGSPPGTEVLYCDLPCRPPASENPLGTSASHCQSVVDSGLAVCVLGRGVTPQFSLLLGKSHGSVSSSRGASAGLLKEHPTTAPGSRSREPEAVPYLEGLASSLGGRLDEVPGSGTSSIPDCDTPDDTSNSSSVGWDTVERQQEAPHCSLLTVMIPWLPPEGPRADSARRAPSILARPPVGGDATGQRKEDTSCGSRSPGRQLAKLRGEGGCFLERHQSALSQASSATPQSGPRSATPQTPSLCHAAQRDITQAAFTQLDAPRVTSPTQNAQRDKPRTLSTHQDTPRTSSTRQDTPRASSPSRITQRDNPRTSSTQRNNPQLPSPPRTIQQDSSRSSSTQQDDSRASFPTRAHQCDKPRTSGPRDNPRASSPNRTTQRENSRTSCSPQDNPRASSPNRTIQKENTRTSYGPRDSPRASSPNRTIQKENTRTSCGQWDNPRASSPNRTIQKENTRTSCGQWDNPRASSPNRTTQRENSRTSYGPRDNPRASSPNRTTQRENSRTSCGPRDNPRASSPNRTTQRENSRTSCGPRDNPRASSPNRTTQRENSRTSCGPRDNPRASSPNRTTQRENSRTSCGPRDNPRASSPNRTIQRENSRTSCGPRDNPRASSPNRTIQKENTRTSCGQWDNSRASSPNRTTQREKSRTSCSPRDNPRASSPNRTIQKENTRTSCGPRDNPRASSPNRTTQRDNPWTSYSQQNPRSSSTQRENPKAACTQWDKLRASCTQQDNPRSASSRRDKPGTSSPQCCTQQSNPGTASPHRSQRGNPRNSSPHRTNKDIPWASFPLRPTQSDGPRSSSPSRSKPSEVPWASIALRPTQGERPQTSSPTRVGPPSSGPSQQNSPSRTASSSLNPGQHGTSRTSSPLYPTLRGAPQPSSEPAQAPCAVCIGHRDAPRASSPPRYLQHDPFPFFPDPHVSESESPHHDPPYMPPAVCIGHRDAPRASSPPRHTQFDPFPFLPDTSDAEDQPPQHDPPLFPPPVCIGYRDAPRASSPPRQTPEPSLLLQDLPRASTESLAPSTDSLHEPPHIPTPVCIGHRDAPYFSSPPRQVPEPSLFFQDHPGTSMESLAPSIDSLHGSTMLPPQVCIGHRDAPRASSPPRHPPSDLAFLASSPPPGSSGGSRGSVPPGETRHNLEREEYSMLADLPPPRRLAQREPGPQCSNGGRTRSPGRAEVERLFGQERRKSEAPGAFQARDEGQSQRPSQGQSQLLRRQSSPALSREVTKTPVKQAAPARRSQGDPPPSRSPERRPEGNQRLQTSSQPPRTSARTPEREQQMEKPLERGRAGPRQSLGGWRSQEELPGSRGPHRHLEKSGSSQEEGPGLGGWQGLEKPIRGAARALEGTWGDLPKESEESWGQLCGSLSHGGQSEPWEEPPSNGLRESPNRPAQRGWGSLQELSSPHQPNSPTENSSIHLAGFSKSLQPETPTAEDQGAEGEGPHLQGPKRQPELDWRDLAGLLREQTLASHLPRQYWEGLLELLQAQRPRKDPAGHWGGLTMVSGPELDSLGPSGALEQEQHHQPEGWAQATLVNGHSPGQGPQSSAQPPRSACTSTQWPKTKVTSGPETSTLPGLEESGQLGRRSPAGGPSSPERKFQSEAPEESDPSRGQDSLTDQKLADSADKRPAEGKAGRPLKSRLVSSWRMPGDRPTLFNPFLLSLGVLTWQRPDLLNFKKGWMSILDEPEEWKKHWFVLTDSSLKYYRDSTAEEADQLDGEIDLRSCTDVTEYAVQRNYGFQIHTKDAVYTLSAMTSGIRRNWIEALRKTMRPTSAPDVTKLSDCNKENTLHGYGTQRGSLKVGEQRAGSEVISRGAPRKADGQRPSLDYVELSPMTQCSPQRARAPTRTLDRPAKQEELERDLAQRSEERRKWFEATDGRVPETPAGEAPRRGLGAPLTEDQQSRLSEEIEKKWQELEKLPLRENKRVPLSALLNQSRGERRGTPSDSHEALEKEVQSLRAQLEAWRLRGEALQEAPKSQEDSPAPPGYISQEVCERSLAEMESLHQQVMEELQRHHERELQRLQQEKESLLAEETAATASAIEAMRKAFEEELSRELSKTRSLQQGPDGLQKQHQSDVEALKRELQVLSEQYSQKCLEIGALTRQAEEREHTLWRCQQESQELLCHNQELHACLSEEIDRLRSFIASQGSGCGRSNKRSSCELEVLLRVKEKELQYLKKEVQCLREELQMMQKDQRFASGKYQDVYVELNHIKTRSEREIEQLKEHLRLAMAALQEKEALHNSLAE
ncbi:TRIO and F-actin-binding protein [Talpa occidentalis]|uniref:TRIO and F-actin-binding protein n=1 Tax=Talpa occidentalis TaxID=50954 RepID=UPI0023FA45BD|nr:TRIO and F-actin-binding protein [Talpa occidentalis]